MGLLVDGKWSDRGDEPGACRGYTGTVDFWRNTDYPPEGAHVLWVGAGTKGRLLVIARGLV
jgi:hypothetical protein